jgi:ADP-ribosylglycohydrolase
MASEPLPSTGPDRALGAFLGTFVGDALGMPFEGLPHTDVPAAVEMVAARRGRGTYTDDTQMMIALAESLIERGRVDDQHLASAFTEAYEPDRGYGRGTRRVLELWANGTPVASAAAQIFDGHGSRRNGAAMRIAPIAVLFRDNPPRLLTEAARSARITHSHPVGVDAAVVQAAAIGAALREEDILEAALDAAHAPEMTDGLRDVGELLLTPPDRCKPTRGSGAPQTRASRSAQRSTRRSRTPRLNRPSGSPSGSAATPTRSRP